jgi:hypothetical protein
MGEETSTKSAWKSATVIAAVIGFISALISAVVPWWLGSYWQQEPTAVPAQAAAVATITPVPVPARTLPNLTLGGWTLFDSLDEEGHDYRGSTIKFKSQRETPDGLELTGTFEWRTDNQVLLGKEHFIAHYDASTRQIFIEGQWVENPSGLLAVGSFSAKLSDDGRQLLEGTWGNTANQVAGVPGSWNARR